MTARLVLSTEAAFAAGRLAAASVAAAHQGWTTPTGAARCSCGATGTAHDAAVEAEMDQAYTAASQAHEQRWRSLVQAA